MMSQVGSKIVLETKNHWQHFALSERAMSFVILSVQNRGANFFFLLRGFVLGNLISDIYDLSPLPGYELRAGWSSETCSQAMGVSPPTPKGSMPQCALVIGVSDQEKPSKKRMGQHFPLFDDENCKNPMAPKYYWKNCTAFPPVWMMKFPKWNGWKMFIEKFGQHFPLFWGWKAKKSNGWKILLEKIGQHFPCLDNENLKWIHRKMFLEKLGSTSPVFDKRNLEVDSTKNVLRKNWAAFSPVLVIRFGKSNEWKIFFEKFGQHFPLFWGRNLTIPMAE